MRYSEFTEQTVVPSTTPAIGITPTANLTGNVSALSDPRMQAANLAKQRQEKDKQKQAVQTQIKTLQTQITTLQKQLSDLNKSA